MISEELRQIVLGLNNADRLEFARMLVASISPAESSTPTVEDGIARMREIFEGKVKPLTEEEFREALG